MALTLGDNFSYQGAKPLDGRLKYETLAAMAAVADATMYDGCLAYCAATDKTYQWKSSNTVDANTGKWREFTPTPDLSAYQTKTLSTPITIDGVEYTTVESALAALNTGGGGGTNINGVLKSYAIKSGQPNVLAGDFIGIQNSQLTTALTDIDTSSSTPEWSASCLLSEGIVAIAYRLYTSQIYLSIVQVSGDTITVLTSSMIENTYFGSGQKTNLKLIRLSSSRVLLGFNVVSNNQPILFTCDYDGSAITTARSNAVWGTSATGTSYSIAAFDENNVLFAYRTNSSSDTNMYLRHVHIASDGAATADTEVTVASDASLFDANNADFLATIDEEHIIYAYNKAGAIQGAICTLSEGTVTVGTFAKIADTNSGTCRMDITVVSTTKAVVLSNSSSGANYLYCYPVAIDLANGSVSVGGSNLAIAYASNTTSFLCIGILDSATIYVCYQQMSGSTSGYVTNVFVGLSGSNMVTLASGKPHSDSDNLRYPAPCKLDDSRVFYGIGGGGHMQASIATLDRKVLSSYSTIGGVANTSGAAGDTIEVYIPR